MQPLGGLEPAGRAVVGKTAHRRPHDEPDVTAAMLQPLPQHEARALQQVGIVGCRRQDGVLVQRQHGAEDVGLAAEVAVHEGV